MAKQRCKVINETLSKRPTEWAQNVVNLLNIVPSSSLQIIGVKDRTTLTIWARIIITKHNLSNSVQNKVAQLEKSVHDFKDLFEELFIKGLPSFWDGKGNLHEQESYNALLTQARMDHSRFKYLDEVLKGEIVEEMFAIDFEILNKFKIIKLGLPFMSYVSCINLEILIKEMMDYDIPS